MNLSVVKWIAGDPERVKEGLRRRRLDPDLVDDVLSLNGRRRAIQARIDHLKHLLRKRGSRELKLQIRALQSELKEVNDELFRLAAAIPNVPHPSVPDCIEGDSVVVKEVGRIPEFDFEPKPHWEIGEELGIFDFESASKMSGSRFVVLRGAGATLERALVNLMLYYHTRRNSYEKARTIKTS